MTIRHDRDQANFLSPHELRDLQALFQSLCAERRLAPNSAEGELMATHLMALYRSGIEDEQLLRSILAEGGRR